jgi:chromosome segregation ATPase
VLIDAVAAFREAQERTAERKERFRTERDAALAELGEQRTRAAVAAAKLEAAEAALIEVRAALDEARRPFWARWFWK